MPAAPDAAPFSDEEIERLFLQVGAPIAGARGAIVAVSGGSDSIALLVLLDRWRRHNAALELIETPLVVATVDHRLRPGSAAEAAAVAALCEVRGFPHVTLTWDGEKPASGLQEAAREARYALLMGEAGRRGFDCVVTAHTLDDHAETVLMRLARGSGVKGLAGMAEVSFREGFILHRPLLGTSRGRLRAMLEREGVAWIDDPSNADPRFLRPRLRALLPKLAEEGLDAARLAGVARKLRRTDDAIEHGVRNFFAGHVAVEDRARGTSRCLEAHWFGSDPSAVSWRPAGPADGATRRVTLALDPFCLEPLETAMRILSRAIAALAGPEVPIGDEPLEALAEDIDTAYRHGRPLQRTLAGALVSAGTKTIRISPEPPRRSRRQS